MPNNYAQTGYQITGGWMNTPTRNPFELGTNFPTTGGYNPNSTIPIRVSTLPNGTPQVSAGGTTLDKLLAALTTNLALIKGAGYIPTTQQPQQQYYDNPYAVNPYQNSIGGGSTGASFGAGIESFIANNTGLLLIGVVALVLFKSGRK